MARIRLDVLVRDEWRDRYPEVLEQCRQAGLNVEFELAKTGVIGGHPGASLAVSRATEPSGIRSRQHLGDV